jgi:hypothetical protein
MALVEIGTSIEAVRAAKAAILEILNTHNDQETIRVALRAFVDSIQPANNTFSGCSFGAPATRGITIGGDEDEDETTDEDDEDETTTS